MSDFAFAQEILATQIGFTIRMARLRREKSVDELVLAAGVPRRTILRLERGEWRGSLRPISDCLFALGYEPIEFDLRPTTEPVS